MLTSSAYTVNGATADIAQTVRGSDFYFAICAVMGASAFTVLALSFRKHRRDRIFHYITASILSVATIAYFSMGANLGFTPIAVEFHRNDPQVRGAYRQVFYARYIDWFITTPLLLLDLLLTAGMPWPTIFWVILCDWIMIITGLIGALVVSRYKWGYFAFGIIFNLILLSHEADNGQDVSPFATLYINLFGRPVGTLRPLGETLIDPS